VNAPVASKCAHIKQANLRFEIALGTIMAPIVLISPVAVAVPVAVPVRVVPAVLGDKLNHFVKGLG
jgi:hypothetical protein